MTVAYSPTTWNTNDVITKDKLNKIEQGINTASKLSGTDIDTDKDWNGKSITNVGSLTSHGETIINTSGEFAGGGAAYVLYADPACAAANLCNQVLGEYSRQNIGYGKMVELSPIPSSVAIPNVKHTVTVQWQTWIYYGAPYAGYTRVYINGSPVGVEKISSVSTTVSETIEVEPGDIISIWGHSTEPSEYSTGIVYVSNVKLFAFAVPAGRPQMW